VIVVHPPTVTQMNVEAHMRRAPLPPTCRLAALGGLIGPAAFIGGWTIGAAMTGPDYSSVDQAISRLAEVGADSRLVMTTGFVALGVGLGVYATALRHAVGGLGWITATATGVTTLAVAATPLARSATVDTVHAVAAGIGYVALAATPLLSARPLLQGGHRRLAKLGIAAGIGSGMSLVLASSGLPTGLFQRIGLTTTHVWIAASALAIAAGERPVAGSDGRRDPPARRFR
jgi:hypothetical membrane protein